MKLEALFMTPLILLSCITLQKQPIQTCVKFSELNVFLPMKTSGCSEGPSFYKMSIDKKTKHEIILFKCPDSTVVAFYGLHTLDKNTIQEEMSEGGLNLIGQCSDGSAEFNVYKKVVIIN